MERGYKRWLKVILGVLYIILSGINLLGLKYHAWTCTEKSITYQIWLTVSVILAYKVFCIIYKGVKLIEDME